MDTAANLFATLCAMLETAADPRRWDSEVLTLATDALHASLREPGTKARERLLTRDDVAYALERHAAAVHAVTGACTILTKADGGAVANSYRYRADSDMLLLVTVVSERDGNLVVDGTAVEARRTWAPKVAYGRSGDTSTQVFGPELANARYYAQREGLDAPHTLVDVETLRKERARARRTAKRAEKRSSAQVSA